MAERGIAAPLAIGCCAEEPTLASSGPNRRNPDLGFMCPETAPFRPWGQKPRVHSLRMNPYSRSPNTVLYLLS